MFNFLEEIHILQQFVVRSIVYKVKIHPSLFLVRSTRITISGLGKCSNKSLSPELQMNEYLTYH